MRNYPASSVGPGYVSVWHRDPAAHWTVHTTAAPELSCPRYLGNALAAAYVSAVHVDWTDAWSLIVRVPGVPTWRMSLAADPATRIMSVVGGVMPDRARRAGWLLGPVGVIAGPLLSIGPVRLHGVVPNGQTFGAVPRKVWRIATTSAIWEREELGEQAPLKVQDHLGDFLLPQRGLFFADCATVFTAPAEVAADAVATARAVMAGGPTDSH